MKKIIILTLLLNSFISGKAQSWQYIDDITGCLTGTMITFNGELYLSDPYQVSSCGLNGCSSNIIKFDGTSWNCVGSLQYAMTNKLITYNNELYAGGTFVLDNGTHATVIKLSNGNWSAIKNNPNFPATIFCVYRNELYEVEKRIGADTTILNKWDGVSWTNILFLPPNPYQIHINTLEVYHDELYIAGEFTNIAGVNTNNIIRYNGNSFSDVGGGLPLCFSEVKNFHVFNDTLYMSGDFCYLNNIFVNQIAKWDGTSWISMGNGMREGVYDATGSSGTINNLNGHIIVIDEYVDSLNFCRRRIAEWNNTNWETITPEIEGVGFYDMIFYNNELYAGGDFYDQQNHYVLMKLSQSTDIHESIFKNQNIIVSPNPVSNNLNFILPDFKSSQVLIEIFSSNGRKDFSCVEENFFPEKNLNVEFLQSGLYMLRISVKKEIFYSTFIKK